MSKQIFKTNTQGKPYQTKITKDKTLLKASLNKMLHPDICGRQFADMIKQLKEKQKNPTKNSIKMKMKMKNNS
jgi:hypothetical protein